MRIAEGLLGFGAPSAMNPDPLVGMLAHGALNDLGVALCIIADGSGFPVGGRRNGWKHFYGVDAVVSADDKDRNDSRPGLGRHIGEAG